jgi:hypothetical protein
VLALRGELDVNGGPRLRDALFDASARADGASWSTSKASTSSIRRAWACSSAA